MSLHFSTIIAGGSEMRLKGHLDRALYVQVVAAVHAAYSVISNPSPQGVAHLAHEHGIAAVRESHGLSADRPPLPPRPTGSREKESLREMRARLGFSPVRPTAKEIE